MAISCSRLQRQTFNHLWYRSINFESTAIASQKCFCAIKRNQSALNRYKDDPVSCCLKALRNPWTEFRLWRHLRTPRSCLDVPLWWSAWRKVSRSHWCRGADKVRPRKASPRYCSARLEKTNGFHILLERQPNRVVLKHSVTSDRGSFKVGLPVEIQTSELLLSSPAVSQATKTRRSDSNFPS